jgi:hypothetical protein
MVRRGSDLRSSPTKPKQPKNPWDEFLGPTPSFAKCPPRCLRSQAWADCSQASTRRGNTSSGALSRWSGSSATFQRTRGLLPRAGSSSTGRDQTSGAGAPSNLREFGMACAHPGTLLARVAWWGVSLAGRPQELRDSGAFEAVYRNVNCFHSAVVVEVEAGQLCNVVAGTQVDASTFLLHMTIGVTREEHDPKDLRCALLPMRNIKLGVGEVTELTHIRFPSAQTTLLQPWTVIEKVSLSQKR